MDIHDSNHTFENRNSLENVGEPLAARSDNMTHETTQLNQNDVNKGYIHAPLYQHNKVIQLNRKRIYKKHPGMSNVFQYYKQRHKIPLLPNKGLRKKEQYKPCQHKSICHVNTVEDEKIHSFEMEMLKKDTENIHTVNTDTIQNELMNSSIFTRFVPKKEVLNEVNLTELLTDVLLEVRSGKLTNIENIIGKLRMDFEEKNVFDTRKNNIMLINFEDDSTRPVLKINSTYIDIIKQWYDNCDICVEMEDTDVFIPESITRQDMSGVLFRDIHYKYVDEYLHSYMPTVVNTILSKQTMKNAEKKYFKNDIPLNTNGKNSTSKNTHTFISTNPFGTFLEKDLKSLNEKKNDINVPQNVACKNLGIVIPESILTLKLNQKLKTMQLTGSHDVLFQQYVFDDYRNNPVNNEIKCYNEDYNVLCPSFGSNCLCVDETDIVQNDLTTIYVLLNDKFLQTMTILNPKKEVVQVIENYPEFGFIKLFHVETHTDVIHFIEREFNKMSFNDIDEINKKLEVVSQYIEFSVKHNSNHILSSEESLVKQFLNHKYIIDNDINHKMKASTLHDIIIESKIVKIENDKLAGFKNRLSKYLKDLGLLKKRYNDGFYYYGIVEKYQNTYPKNTPITKEYMNAYIKERETQLYAKDPSLDKFIKDITAAKHAIPSFVASTSSESIHNAKNFFTTMHPPSDTCTTPEFFGVKLTDSLYSL